MNRPTDSIDDLIDLREAAAKLDNNYQRLVYLYCEMGFKQREIASKLNVTQSAVSQLLEKAILLIKRSSK